MKFSIRSVFLIVLIGISSYIVWNAYSYFFDVSTPLLKLSGIRNEGYYAGDIRCIVSGSDSYKIATLSIVLDGHVLLDTHVINRVSFEHPFTINTISLPSGRHTLSLEAIDGSYAKNRTVKECTFYVDNTPLQAAFVSSESDFKVFQGRTLHVQFQVNKPLKEANINLFSDTYECFPESKRSLIYECFIPIACEEAQNEYVMTLEMRDLVGNHAKLEHVFQVLLFPFKKQMISVSSEKQQEEKEAITRHEVLEKRLVELAAISPKKKLWQGSFYTPIEIVRVTTPYGTIRTTQERGRYMHKALDIINTPKSVVWASQDGIVVLKDRYVYSGNTVVIDHGWGIFSLFFHLDSFADIAVGQPIKRGNPIGTIGKTGYATGYHLHWEMRINNVPVDPLQWTNPTF